MKADHVAVRINDEGDVTILTDGHFRQMNFPADIGGTNFRLAAIFAGKIDDGAAYPGVLVLHLAEGSAAAVLIFTTHSWKYPHLKVWVRGREFFQSNLEDTLIECFGPLHVLDIDLEPTDWIAFCVHVKI